MTENNDEPAKLITKRPKMASTPAPFQINEILELILVHVPPKDLLVSGQCVCKRWETIITTSPRIRRSLFFAPDADHTPAAPDGIYTVNPFIVQAFKPFFKFDVWVDLTIFPPVERVDIALKTTVDDWPVAMRHTGASWRKMLVAQPPVHEVLVTDRRVAPYYDDWWADSSTNANGVKMGELLLLDEDLVESRNTVSTGDDIKFRD
ncbi:hypothetical protein B0J11DRAFT_581644 [Dendryphion nanum]|uniref:F-box domain-containing protein n=1 Tax=Dendryphion nanum TaxID=256645 RepID=A0A9P9IIU1_9PLEO|nr:hypothetical protein B0J11DRAFT_581644 [Dendryphion nanum]